MEAELMNIGALVPNEKVKLAYKCGRDAVICTSKRMLYVDCQGISGIFLEMIKLMNLIYSYSLCVYRKENRIPEYEIQLYQSI